MKRNATTPIFAVLGLAAVLFVGPAASRAGTPVRQTDDGTQVEEPESSPEYIEQYEAWERADKEPDLPKRGAMLSDFINKYPKSTLMPYADASFKRTLMECNNGQKYQELETLSEQWLKLHPGDLDGLGFAVKAERELGHNEKAIQNLGEIYKIRKTGDWAIEIAQTYKRANDKTKYLEWTQTALGFPEYATDFRTRLELMQAYVEDKNFPKAIEYAEAALAAADRVKDPGAETAAAIQKVRRGCYDGIGKIHMEQDNFAAAIKSFQQALQVAKYSEGYYLIAVCLHKQNRVDDAMLWYARTEQQGGEFAAKAKDRLEEIYRALHNNTLIGSEKIYRRAKESPEIVEARPNAK
ncbi:MAG TPA: tetratricopeptide repeat protein [Acidobacteriota bacterium]|nr:tetratricopeptide repeat protein [Acidobacteriota bacterium]